jgi:hypothetical protein
LTDEAYAKLLDKLAGAKFVGVSTDLLHNVLGYYSDPNAPDFNKKKPEQREKTLRNLEEMKALNLEKVAMR